MLLNENFTYEQLNESYKKSLYNVIYLSMELRKVLNNDDFIEIETKINKIYESMDYCSKILKFGNLLINSHSDNNVEIKDDLGQLRFIQPNIEANSPFQNLLLYLLDSIYISGLQRYGESLYEKIYYNGHFTHAWKEKITIRKFIYENTM